VTPILRPFQTQLKADVYAAWNAGARNVLMRLDTGGGKTVTLADIVRENVGGVCVIAHRSELVGQLSVTLARYGVRHNIIASESTRRAISRMHIDELGYTLVDPASRVVVASVDTLVRRDLPLAWTRAVTLWVVDEGHHLVENNKWHSAIANFSNSECRGLLPTATPKRADGIGLGRGEGGVADVMVQGPSMRWLIENGYLADYRIVCPPSDLKIYADVSASGDWSTKTMREAAVQSHIVGDVVEAYLRFARGKLGITFSTDVVTAGEITTAYRLAGVKAETLTGKTDDTLRRSILRRFAAREIDQIVAVDIISEGFDLPAIEVASMARPTQSLALYMQQFGRALRVSPGKDKALIIDHVSNILRHGGPPDKVRTWTLAKAHKRSSSETTLLRVCTECFEPYERELVACPHCGAVPVPQERSRPAMVDGDLEEMSPALLASLRNAVEDARMSPAERREQLRKAYAPAIAQRAGANRQAARLDALNYLRAAMAAEGGRWKVEGLDDRQMQRRFFLRYGIDVLSAQALGSEDAYALATKINA
jgi:DNA repair protein RadD